MKFIKTVQFNTTVVLFAPQLPINWPMELSYWLQQYLFHSFQIILNIAGYQLVPSVQFRYSRFVLLSVSRVACNAHLRFLEPYEPCGCFRGECCTGSKSMTAQRVNNFHSLSLPSTRLNRAQAPFSKSSVWPELEADQACQLWCHLLNQLYHSTGLSMHLNHQDLPSRHVYFKSTLAFTYC